jgi:hypothetical protein
MCMSHILSIHILCTLCGRDGEGKRELDSSGSGQRKIAGFLERVINFRVP